MVRMYRGRHGALMTSAVLAVLTLLGGASAEMAEGACAGKELLECLIEKQASGPPPSFPSFPSVPSMPPPSFPFPPIPSEFPIPFPSIPIVIGIAAPDANAHGAGQSINGLLRQETVLSSLKSESNQKDENQEEFLTNCDGEDGKKVETTGRRERRRRMASEEDVSVAELPGKGNSIKNIIKRKRGKKRMESAIRKRRNGLAADHTDG